MNYNLSFIFVKFLSIKKTVHYMVICFFSIGLLLSGLYSCNKDCNPEPNHNNNTSNNSLTYNFTATVSGESFQSNGSASYNNDGFLTITGTITDEETSKTIGIVIPYVDSLDYYYLYNDANINGDNPIPEGGFYIYTNTSTSTKYATEVIIFPPSTYNTGYLTITKSDYTNKLISGTFYFNAKQTNGSNSVSITSGNFTDITVSNWQYK